MNLEQLFGNRSAHLGYLSIRSVPRDLEEHLASQRVTAGVQTGGGQPEQEVACLNRRAGDHALALHDADDEAGQVVLAACIEPRHLGGLAADERAAVGEAAPGDP